MAAIGCKPEASVAAAGETAPNLARRPRSAASGQSGKLGDPSRAMISFRTSLLLASPIPSSLWHDGWGGPHVNGATPYCGTPDRAHGTTPEDT